MFFTNSNLTLTLRTLYYLYDERHSILLPFLARNEVECHIASRYLGLLLFPLRLPFAPNNLILLIANNVYLGLVSRQLLKLLLSLIEWFHIVHAEYHQRSPCGPEEGVLNFRVRRRVLGRYVPELDDVTLFDHLYVYDGHFLAVRSFGVGAVVIVE